MECNYQVPEICYWVLAPHFVTPGSKGPIHKNTKTHNAQTEYQTPIKVLPGTRSWHRRGTTHMLWETYEEEAHVFPGYECKRTNNVRTRSGIRYGTSFGTISATRSGTQYQISYQIPINEIIQEASRPASWGVWGGGGCPPRKKQKNIWPT